MPRPFAAVVILVVVLMAGLPGIAPSSAAEEATPTNEHHETCLNSEFTPAPDSAVVPDRDSAEDAAVKPYMTSGEVLYVVVVTLPPHTCIPYRERDGAVVLFVNEGTIEYTAQYENDPSSHEIVSAVSDGDPSTLPGLVFPASDETITLGANAWVTQDRKASYTIANPDATVPAEVVIASYVDPPWDDDGCNGGCRKP